jgi:hypothetical protein
MITPRFMSGAITGAVILSAIALVAATIHMTTPDYAGVRQGRIDAGYLESNDCRKCHEGNYATWHATFHRTMTQDANPQSVLGDFDHNHLSGRSRRDGPSEWVVLDEVDRRRWQNAAT